MKVIVMMTKCHPAMRESRKSTNRNRENVTVNKGKLEPQSDDEEEEEDDEEEDGDE
ncbi:hypothetical protein KIN20_031397 [Parelaphostrongylus tenuis]|uniref:Uncharacterized protein n=1 Tax=Parelaphostrongylus tenuis TaxID=148309 RepID=A0AAD5R5E3_PARTN|nr:hypothetical protein KIN20_031397 [Parelaphostrongylus tenuis]